MNTLFAILRGIALGLALALLVFELAAVAYYLFLGGGTGR